MMLSLMLWFFSKIYIVRHITTEELGIYSLLVAMAGIVSAVASLGIQEGISRYVSMFAGEMRKDDSDSISGSAIKFGVISGVFFSLLLFFCADILSCSFFYKPELAIPFKIISFTVFCSVMINIICGIFRGHNIMAPRVYILDLGQPFFFLVLLWAFFHMGLPFLYVIYAYLFAIIAVFILFVSYLFKSIGMEFLFFKGSKYCKELIRFSLPLLVATILGVVLTWCDTIMLGRYSSSENVGVYNISISLARLLIFPLSAMEFVFMPIAAGMYVQKQFSELNKTYQILTKWIFAVTIPMFFIMFFFPEMTISFLFGERFIAASMPLQILAAGFLFHAFFGANVVLLIIMGKSRDIMIISIFGTLLNVFLNYVLIKHLGYGTAGSAVATLITYVAINIAASILLYKISAIHPLTPQHIKPIFSSTIIGLLIYGIAKILPLSTWMLPVYLLLYLAGYFISLLITKSIEQEEVALFDAISEKTGLRLAFIRNFLKAAS